MTTARDIAQQQLSTPDSIMEQNISTTLSEFLTSGGRPLDAVLHLSESYVGYAPMCNLVSEWSDMLNISGPEVMQNALRELLMERFDPDSVDAEFTSSQTTPDWLETMIENPFWRKVIYDLSEKYQRCVLLNFAIQRIADAGHKNEISKVSTASTFINVFSGVLVDSLAKLREADNTEIEEGLPDLVKVCCQHEQTYAYAQALLEKLCNERGGASYKLISKQLESEAIQRNYPVGLINTLRVLLTQAPPQVVDAISATLQNKHPTAGDILALYKAYSVPQPPSIFYLRDPEFFEIILSAIVTKSIRSEYKPQVIWLVALAASGKQEREGKIDRGDQTKTIKTLTDLIEILEKKSTGADLNSSLKDILGNHANRNSGLIDTPVASMILLLWIQNMLTETQYYETYFRATEVPVPHLLLEEIAYRHPLQQPYVFRILQKNLEMTLPNLSPETSMAIRRTVLDRMVYLVQLGYVLPVLRYVGNIEKKMDESLIVHFIKKVLELASPPYSDDFVNEIAKIVGPKIDGLKKIEDVKTLVGKFFGDAIDHTALSPQCKERVLSVNKKLQNIVGGSN